MTRKGRRHAKEFPKKVVRKTWPMKIAALIVSAIQDLRETKGSTPRKIIGYINYASDMAAGRVKRQVKSVLKRGVEYGILRRYRGHYFLPTGDELVRANRVALRFAKLPLPAAYSTKSSTFPARQIRPPGSQRSSRKSGARSQKAKRLVKPRAPLIPPTVSLAPGAICNVDDL